MFITVKRIFRSGFVGFWRNTFVSLAAIFVMTVALFVIASTLLLDQLLGASLEQVRDKVDINVYFDVNAEQSEIDALVNSLEALPEVTEVRLTSREENLAAFQERHRNDELMVQTLDELGDNPLGASLAVRAQETTQYESINQFLLDRQALEEAQTPVIDRVNYVNNKEAIDKLTAIIDAVERSSLIALFVLLAASILITFNTIRLAIYTAREEIAVQRLVGASNMFIRGPFMLQGVMYGFIAGLLTLLMMWPIMVYLGPATEKFFQFNVYTYFWQHIGYLFAVLVGSGSLLGLISSILAVSRYLRV